MDGNMPKRSCEGVIYHESSLLNCTLRDDFGGGYLDTNSTYAKELVAWMGLVKVYPNS
jgi:hypothetical protein